MNGSEVEVEDVLENEVVLEELLEEVLATETDSPTQNP